MQEKLDYKVHEKETIYFTLKIFAAIFGYYLLYSLISLVINSPGPQRAAFAPIAVYLVLIILYLLFRIGFLVGYLKGNAIKVTNKQFPDIHRIVVKQSELLGLKTVPDFFIMQSGGVLNAFATRFMGSDYVVIYSEILEEAYENNIETVEFVIGHELGHVKRKHMLKRTLLFPAFIIPFVNSAYSRACELTCDDIGASLNMKGARSGLILLASGKKIWKRTSIDAFAEQELTEGGFWFWFSEKTSTHPRLSKRISRFQNRQQSPVKPVIAPALTQLPVQEETLEKPVKPVSDHSTFMPK